MYNKAHTLSNGCYFVYHNQTFDLELNGQAIVKECIMCNYSDRLIVVRQSNKLIVFSTKIITVNGNRTLEKLAEAHYLASNAKISVYCGTTYFIDYDCNIFSV